MIVLLLGVAGARAQEDVEPSTPAAGDTEELNIIEVELDKSKPAPAPPDAREKGAAAEKKDDKPIDFQGLGRLAPFTEVSVLQKRYLPKTGRFHAFLGGSLITNDPFYNTVGGALKLGYFLTESIGVEANYFGFSTSEAKATQELKEIQNVGTDSLIITKSFSGVDVIFVPVYGKITWFNERIIPFDMYFSMGGGTTVTQSESAGTLHAGMGQIFAASKSSGFRWDFSWNMFSATGIDGKKQSYNNVFLTLGWGWFFPEAKYR